MPEENPTNNLNSENLPIIEETSLHHIVLRVRDWQETIDKKFGRKEAYLEFENDEVNAFKKELLDKGEVDEHGNPVDRFYPGVEYEMKRFQLIKDPKSEEWADLSKHIYFKNNNLHLNNCFLNIEYEGDEKTNFSYGFICDKVNLHLETGFNFSKKVIVKDSKVFIESEGDIEFHQLYITGSYLEIRTLDDEDKIIINGESVIKHSTFGEISIYALDILGNLNLEETIFKNNIGLIRIDLLGNSTIINNIDVQKTLTIGYLRVDSQVNLGNYNYLKYGKIFRKSIHFIDYFVENFNDYYEFSTDTKIFIHNTDIGKLWDNIDDVLKFVHNNKNTKGENIINIDWKTCEPKPFQYTIQISSKYKEYYSFIEDFSTLFKRYAIVNHIPDISVAINPAKDSFDIVFESSSEENIKDKIVGIQANLINFLSDPETFNQERESWNIGDRSAIASSLNAVKTNIVYYQKDDNFWSIFGKIFGNGIHFGKKVTNNHYYLPDSKSFHASVGTVVDKSENSTFNN